MRTPSPPQRLQTHRQVRCGKCKKIGHNRRTCGKQNFTKNFTQPPRKPTNPTSKKKQSTIADINIPEEQPQRSVDEKGNIMWKLDGKLHNPHGPALIRPEGDKEWFLYGKHTRIGKPAIERPNGSTFWFVEDKLHRTDGPSIEHPDGTTYWDVNGIRTKRPALCKKAILPTLTDEEFYKLCTHEDYVVRELAIHNPHCPEEWRTLGRILYD